MPWYKVRVGWEISCGGEWQEYITKARSKKHARMKVLEVHTKIKSDDQIKVELLDPQPYDNGVIYSGYDYWER